MRKLVCFVLICITVFCIFNYIFLRLGNNKVNNEKRIDDILEKHLNYEAEIEVTINSNKTQNKYKMKQTVKDNLSKTQIIEPENLSSMTIEKEGNILKVTNSILNVEKCYENEQELLNNYLFLNVFINDSKENEKSIAETEDEIYIEVKTENNPNTYVKLKKLVIDKNTKKAKELIIKDNANNVVASIIYNDLKI